MKRKTPSDAQRMHGLMIGQPNFNHHTVAAPTRSARGRFAKAAAPAIADPDVRHDLELIGVNPDDPAQVAALEAAGGVPAPPAPAALTDRLKAEGQ